MIRLHAWLTAADVVITFRRVRPIEKSLRMCPEPLCSRLRWRLHPRLEVGEDGRHPMEAGQEAHQVGLGLDDLDMGAQAFDVPCRQIDAVGVAELEEGCEAQAAFEVAV